MLSVSLHLLRIVLTDLRKRKKSKTSSLTKISDFSISSMKSVAQKRHLDKNMYLILIPLLSWVLLRHEKNSTPAASSLKTIPKRLANCSHAMNCVYHVGKY